MTPATGNPRKFHKGPPPFRGWWNVRFPHDTSERRWGWWDGKGWSTFARSGNTPRIAAAAAAYPGAEYVPKTILWSDYWPANARVPRINPNKEKA